MRADTKGGRAPKRKVIMIFLVLAVCFLGGGFWFFRHRGDKGVAVKPKGEYPVGEVLAYYQRDQDWKEDTLGSSSFHMGGSGCLTTCIASALSTQAQSCETGYVITPGELNQKFGETGVYNSQGDIVWDKVKEALPEVEVTVASSVKGEDIEGLLALGRFPLVKVKVGGYGAFHWVLIVGSKEGEYLCMDPLREDGKLIPLSSHGTEVYRLRCVYWER